MTEAITSQSPSGATSSVLSPSTAGLRSWGRGLSRAARSARTRELLDIAYALEDEEERARVLGEVVVLNCRVADAVAARYRDRGVPLEDLQQAAYEGLVKAVSRFDPEHSDDLLTFAVPTIRGEVQRYFRDRSWMVRPPRRIQELQSRTNVVIDALMHGLGREPTHAEVRDELGVDAAEYAEAMAGFGCFRPPSLDQPVGDDASSTIGDLVVVDRDEQAAAEARCMLGPVVRDLCARDRRVLYLRFFEGRTQREIGEDLGITQMQVSRLLDRILSDLRFQLQNTSPSQRDLPSSA